MQLKPEIVNDFQAFNFFIGHEYFLINKYNALSDSLSLKGETNISILILKNAHAFIVQFIVVYWWRKIMIKGHVLSLIKDFFGLS